MAFSEYLNFTKTDCPKEFTALTAAPEQLSIHLNKLSYLQLQDFLVTFDSSNSSSFFAFFSSYKVFTDLTFKINSRFNVFQWFFCYCCCCFSVDCETKIRMIQCLNTIFWHRYIKVAQWKKLLRIILKIKQNFFNLECLNKNFHNLRDYYIA